MQNAMPYRTWRRWPTFTHQNKVITWAGTGSGSLQVINGGKGDWKSMVKENAVIVFAKKGCCMSHVVERLLQVAGANPAVCEVEEKEMNDMISQLTDAGGGENSGLLIQFPAVFIGGQWFGGLERIIATHITEELIPLLKQAGALWL